MTSTYLVVYNIYGEVDEGLTGLRQNAITLFICTKNRRGCVVNEKAYRLSFCEDPFL